MSDDTDTDDPSIPDILARVDRGDSLYRYQERALAQRVCLLEAKLDEANERLAKDVEEVRKVNEQAMLMSEEIRAYRDRVHQLEGVMREAVDLIDDYCPGDAARKLESKLEDGQ